jgi:hypothetical protein
VRYPLRPAFFLAVALATGPSASAQGPIDTSSPDAVMASLAELHESWTHDQFVDFMRAAMTLNIPEEIASRTLREDRELSDLIEGIGLLYALARHAPLVLEADPFLGHLDLSPPWFQEILERPLRDRAGRPATCHARSRHACAAPASRQLSEPRPIQACPRLRFPCGRRRGLLDDSRPSSAKAEACRPSAKPLASPARRETSMLDG